MVIMSFQFTDGETEAQKSEPQGPGVWLSGGALA